jgi:hypothetical protein
MIKPYKNRTINPDKPVKVYWNLRLDCYSVQQSGKVVTHADQVELRDVTFHVNESGRQRVLKERRKNVHAFVVGYLDEYFAKRDWDIKIVYNPYKYDSFRLWASDKVTVTSADAVILGIRNGKSEILADRDVESYLNYGEILADRDVTCA